MTQFQTWLRVAVLYAAGLMAAGQFAKMSVSFEALELIYAGNGNWLSLSVSIISFLGAALGLVIGMLVAQIGFRRVLLWGLLGGAVLSAVQAMLPALNVMLLTRLIEGSSHLAIVVAAPTLIAELTNDRQRSAAMALWSTFFAAGYAIFAFLSAPVLASTGPQPIFWAHAIFCVVVAALIARLIAPRNKRSASVALSIGQILRRHAQIYRSAKLATAPIGWLFYTLTFVSALTLLPRMTEAANWLAPILPLFGIVVSLTLVVWLMRHLRAVSVVAIGFALAAAITALLALAPAFVGLWIILFGALAFIQAASFAAIPQLNHDMQDRALATGAMAQMGNLGNLIGTPLLFMAIQAGGNTAGFAMLCAAYLAGLIAYFYQMKRLSAGG